MRRSLLEFIIETSVISDWLKTMLFDTLTYHEEACIPFLVYYIIKYV